MWKKIGIFVAIAALVGGIVIYKMWTQPHADMLSQKADIATEAAALATNYDDAKFLNKTVEISGKIAEVVHTDSLVVLTLEGTGDFTINCPLDPFSKQKTDFTAGQTVKLKGICLGKDLLDIKFDRCVVIP